MIVTEVLQAKVLLKNRKRTCGCQVLLKTLGDEIVSVFIEADANQCMLIEGVIYHKDKHKNSLDGQLQLVMSEVSRR